MNLGCPQFICPTRLLCPEVSPAMKCIHSFTHTRRPITSVKKPPSSWILIIWLVINERHLCSSCNFFSAVWFLLFLFHIQDWGYNPKPCNLSHHCDSLCSRMMVYKWIVHMKVNQIHQYLFCHKSRPVLGEMHLDHHHSILVWPAPKVIQYVFHQEVMLAISPFL